jgi:hypothetical protein
VFCTLGSVTVDILSIEGPSNPPEEEIIAMLIATERSRCRWRATLITIATGICILMLLASIRVPAQTQSPQNAAAPQGWGLAGSNPTNYETGLDPQASYHGFSSAYLKAKPSAVEGFGTLMQEFSASQYAGKRVRLRASVKAEGVNDWAGLWMRIDKGSTAVSFDNMRDRPIKGTTTWQDYEVILDVPQDATHIAFGILLSKSGSVWLNGVKFESVGLDVPATAKAPRQLPEGPTNLNFQN